MKTKLNDLIYYFTPLTDEHRTILSTAIAFVLYCVSIYMICYFTNP